MIGTDHERIESLERMVYGSGVEIDDSVAYGIVGVGALGIGALALMAFPAAIPVVVGYALTAGKVVGASMVAGGVSGAVYSLLKRKA